MSNSLQTIERAIDDIAAGKMVIMVDDERRENEGDLVIAAEFMTEAAMNFMIKQARGLVCMPMVKESFERLGISAMVSHNTAPRQTAFGVSIEAREGVTTGISAADRAHTVRVAANPQSTAADLVRPGHIFPLCAADGGVLVRPGHTEGSVDLARLAGCQPAAVICEIINDDGTMARLPQLQQFAQQHQLAIVSIQDLITYRLTHEVLVEAVASAHLPVKAVGEFTLTVFSALFNEQEIVVLSKPLQAQQLPLVRLHSACLTGDVFGSLRCDCGEQLSLSLERVAAEGGHVIYLPQEGRGIGLVNKIKAYALQEQGLDTVEANQQLGFDADLRDYGLAAQVLKKLGVTQLRLLTNNPRKVSGLQQYGITVAERVPLQVAAQCTNQHYLQTKRDKLGHWVETVSELQKEPV